jgi:hypothetical protein
MGGIHELEEGNSLSDGEALLSYREPSATLQRRTSSEDRGIFGSPEK